MTLAELLVIQIKVRTDYYPVQNYGVANSKVKKKQGYIKKTEDGLREFAFRGPSEYMK